MIAPDLVADAGVTRQLVDHLALDQRRVHVERDEPAVAPEDRVVLERDVDIARVGHARQLGANVIFVNR